MQRYIIRSIPEATDFRGRAYPACFDVTLVCSRGMRWHGGSYPTRAEAVSMGEHQSRMRKAA